MRDFIGTPHICGVKLWDNEGKMKMKNDVTGQKRASTRVSRDVVGCKACCGNCDNCVFIGIVLGG